MLRAARVIAFGLMVCACGTLRGDLIIDVDFTGDPQFAPAFASAAQTWENLLRGYWNGHVRSTPFTGTSYTVGQTVSTVFIEARVEAIDGPGTILGSAGPTSAIVDDWGYILATDGLMRFDSADVQSLVDNNTWESVILHEMAHVLGFGTLWGFNGVYTTGSGEFTGPFATGKWQSEFGQPGTPDVELGGGSGTANGHWNEVNGGGSLVGITDSQGRDIRHELMTGWLNPTTFISDMTIASFTDIGFLGAVGTPEPGSCLLASLGLGALAVRRRRRQGRRSAD